MNRKYGRDKFPGDGLCKPTDSPTWKRLCGVSQIAQEHMFWQLGQGKVYLWSDHWFHPLSVEEFQNCTYAEHIDQSIVQSWFNGNDCNKPMLEVVPLHVRTTLVLSYNGTWRNQATPVWKLTQDGSFSTATARNVIRKRKPENPLFSYIWIQYLSPTISIFWWKLLNGWLPMDCRIQRKGIELASRCQCCRQMESVEHVILHNSETHKGWSWFSSLC